MNTAKDKSLIKLILKYKIILFFAGLSFVLISPIYLLMDDFFKENASEILQSWYQTEKMNLQQGNYLNSISKLQNVIDNSKIFKGVQIVNQNNNILLNTGKFPVYQNKFTASSSNIGFQKIGFAKYIFTLKQNEISILFYGESTYFINIFNGLICYLLIVNIALIILVYKQKENMDRITFKNEIDLLNLKVKLNNEIIETYEQVAHDIRSPLAALTIAEQNITRLPEELRYVIKSSVDRIQTIANELLKKDTKSNDKSESQETLLPSLLKSIISEKQLEYKYLHNIFLELELHLERTVYCKINESLLKRIISNLINNSIEAIISNNSNGKILVRCNFDKNNNLAIIEVIDNGPGIPRDLLNRIGERGLKTNKSNSNGLGLYHAKKCIAEIGGTFDVKTNNNQGTKITIGLPISKSINLSDDRLAEYVLIDDDELVRITWQLQAKKLGKNLSTFETTDEFLAVADQLSLACNVFIDSELNSTLRGEEFAKHLFDNYGFRNLYLTTGHDPKHFREMHWLKEVRGKQPNF